METILSFSSNSLKINVFVLLPVTNPPLLLPGDTFTLGVLAWPTHMAQVTSRHFKSGDVLVIKCEVLEVIIRDVIKDLSPLMYTNVYELPKTTWM